MHDGNLTVVNCTFSHNQAAPLGPDTGGGAIYVLGSKNGAVIAGSVFTGAVLLFMLYSVIHTSGTEANGFKSRFCISFTVRKGSLKISTGSPFVSPDFVCSG